MDRYAAFQLVMGVLQRLDGFVRENPHLGMDDAPILGNPHILYEWIPEFPREICLVHRFIPGKNMNIVYIYIYIHIIMYIYYCDGK